MPMQKVIIEIKKPCHVDLNTMVSDEKGKFCSVCQTTVVDFTNKSPDEIALYFKENQYISNCGTFNSWDVKTDRKIDQLISFLQNKKLKFLSVFVIGLLVLSGCRTRKGRHTTGQTARFLDEKTNSIENVK